MNDSMTKARRRQLDEMARVWHAAPIDITAWSFFEDEDTWRDLLAAGFAVYINKTLCDALSEHPPRLWFASVWGDEDGVGGACPDDITTLYLGLPLSPAEDSVYWSISLEAVVDDAIESGFISSDTPGKLAARLRELATKLDEASAGKSE